MQILVRKSEFVAEFTRQTGNKIDEMPREGVRRVFFGPAVYDGTMDGDSHTTTPTEGLTYDVRL